MWTFGHASFLLFTRHLYHVKEWHWNILLVECCFSRVLILVLGPFCLFDSNVCRYAPRLLLCKDHCGIVPDKPLLARDQS